MSAEHWILPPIIPSLLVWFVVCNLTNCHDIHIDQHNGIHNASCWSGEQPCSTLELGLKGLQNYSQATLWITEDTYYTTSTPTNYKFVNASDIAIVGVNRNGSDNEVPVEIWCNAEVGLTFLYSNNVTIRGVSMIGCGTLQDSTSLNFTRFHESSEFSFAKFHTALYFLFCRDIELSHVSVNNSWGTGAVFYSTVGTNVIDYACFSANSAVRPQYPGGGGLYIEFSYCTPSFDGTHDNCSERSNVPDNYSRNANYSIRYNVFESNHATIINPQDHTFILPQKSSHLAFGRGGGLSIFFKGNASNNVVRVSNSTLTRNKALWGAGLFVEFQDMSLNNAILIEDSSLSLNECFNRSSDNGTGGGGSRVGFIFFDSTHARQNTITFDNVDFTDNKAYFGGGLSFYVSREKAVSATNQLKFINCHWERNTARVGSAVDLSIWHPVSEGAVVRPSFSKCSFTKNSAHYANESLNGTFVGIGALYTDSIPVSFVDHVNFNLNKQTALAAVSTGIYVEKNTSAYFTDNSGRNGGAVALMGYAFIEVSEQTELRFTNNSADLKGGAIYGHSIGEHDLISSRNCFIRYSDIYSTPTTWNTYFYFENNTAKGETNSIYVTSLLTCLWGGAFGSTDTDAAKLVFCWNNGSTNWNYVDSNCSQNIATSPARFVSKSDQKNYTMEVFPGLRQALPFSTADDVSHNVTKYTVLIAQVENKDESVSLDSSSVYISDNSIDIHGKINASGTLTLETIDPRIISTKVHVTVQDCPPGMINQSRPDGTVSTCTCGNGFNRLVNCHENNYTTQLQRGAWIGFTDNLTVVGQCPYCSGISSSQYLDLHQQRKDLEEQLCGKISRNGTLCGKCKEGFGPAVNSKDFQCMNCTDTELHSNWFFYLLTEFLPITIFFFIVVLFNVSVTSGPANAFVFFAQIITTAITLDGDGSIQAEDVLENADTADNVLRIVPYDIWNLNFFRPWLPEFCLSPYITTLQLLSTGYITAIYPLILVGIFFVFTWLYSRGVRPIVCLCRPIHACSTRVRQFWDFKRSILHALATFILLSYTKFTLVSFILLTSTPLIDDNGDTVSSRLYYDGSIVFGDEHHRPYLIVSVIVLLTFVAFPPILLIAPSIVHFLQSMCTKVPDLCGGALFSQFLNAFHGCYKDGTGGQDGNDNKHDYRWFAGLYFILRVALLAIYAFTPDWFMQCVLQQILCTVALVSFVTLRPYKNDLYNKVDATMLAIIVAICSLSMYNYYLTVVGLRLAKWIFVLQYVLILCPLLYMSVVVVYYFWDRNKTTLKKLFKKCFRKIFKRWNTRTEELVQNERDFFHDTEEAGRFGDREEDSTRSRSTVQNDEYQPLLQNEQSPRGSGGSSGGSSGRRGGSNESGSSYGAAVSAGTQTPTSVGSSFGKTGVVKFQVEEETSEEPKVETDSVQKRRKKLFFTH